MTMTVENTKAALWSKISFGGGATALFGGITSTDAAAIVGAAVAIVGLIVQWYYRAQDEHRKRELHAAEMQGKIRAPLE